MTAREEIKPAPIPKLTVCSVCGLDWALHSKRTPKLEGCVKLLRAELAKRPAWNQIQMGAGGSSVGGYLMNMTSCQ